MAYIYAKSPNGTTQSINIDTMNITSSLQQNGWCKLPNGLIFQWFEIGERNANNRNSGNMVDTIVLASSLPIQWSCGLSVGNVGDVGGVFGESVLIKDTTTTYVHWAISSFASSHFDSVNINSTRFICIGY